MKSSFNYILVDENTSAKSNVQLVACGTGSHADETCNGGTVNANTDLTPGTWYKVSGTSVSITFVGYGEIAAYTSDGVNTSETINDTARESFISAADVLVDTKNAANETVINSTMCTPDAQGRIDLECALDELEGIFNPTA